MALADDLQGDVADLLDDPDYGRTITITRTTPGDYDPETGDTGDAKTTTWTTRGLFLGYRDALIDGTNILRGDRRLYVKLKGITYQAAEGDRITAGSDVVTVVSFKTIELAGTPIIYIMQVRNA